MLSLLILLSLILIFFARAVSLRQNTGIKDNLIKSILIFSLIITLVTETASLFNEINHLTFLSFWIVLPVTLVLYLIIKRKTLSDYTNYFTNKLSGYRRQLTGSTTIGIISVIVLLALVFIQGIINPPNNWDSMTYHLARITAWISHESIAHFPTHIVRQVYQPPFAEFVILNINLLNLNDYLSNSVQFFFLLFSITVILFLLQLLGLKHRFGSIAAVLLITIPEVLLQASSTQNDIVVSFFILAAVLFVIRALKENTIENYFYLGLSIGLAVLTKGTSYIYLAPVLLFFSAAIAIKTYKTWNLKYLGWSVMAALITIAVNSGHYYRNYEMSGGILGVDESEHSRYAMEVMSPAHLVLNMAKNVSNHIGPFPFNRAAREGVNALHQLAGLDPQDPRTNFPGEIYKGAPDFPTHEDTAPNPLHLLLTIISLLWILIAFIRRKKINGLMVYLAIAMIIQLLLFSFYLKWQPWHTRLHTPVFILSIPLIIYFFRMNDKYLKMLKILTVLSIVYGYAVVLLNSSRPYVSTRFTTNISINDNRDKKLFANKLYLFEEYMQTSDIISDSRFRKIGLIIGREDWEYPLFRNSYRHPLKPVHILVNNLTASSGRFSTDVECVVSTTVNENKIFYNSIDYINQTPDNQYVWLYAPYKNISE